MLNKLIPFAMRTDIHELDIIDNIVIHISVKK